jgi:hypothetical protein
LRELLIEIFDPPDKEVLIKFACRARLRGLTEPCGERAIVE